MAGLEVRCPVCHDRFPVDLADFESETDAGTVYFDSVTCKKEFDADPESYPAR